MPKPNGFTIVAKSAGEAEITLYEEIDPNYGVGAKRFRDELKAFGDVSTIHLHINSPGGQVFDGLAIYNTLKNHKARVIVHVDGMAFSMASVIAMAGDEIEAAGNAWLMIHNPVNVAYGDGDDLRHTADVLDRLRNQLATIYAQRSTQPVDKVLELMDAETWFTAAEAAEFGLVTHVTDDVAVAASFNPDRFQNVPERLRKQLTNQTTGATNMAKQKTTTPNANPTGAVEGKAANNNPAPPPTPQGATPPPLPNAGTSDPTATAVAELRNATATETERIAKIRAAFNGQYPDIEAKAIREGWDPRDAELHVLRSNRPNGPAVHVGGQAPNAQALEAGLLLALMHPEQSLLRAYGEETIEQGHRFRKVGIKELIDVCCTIDGRQPLGFGASDVERIRAGFSTTSLPGILSNVAHKVMLEAYTAVPAVAKKLSKPLSASDFKTHTGYRLSGDLTFEEVAQDGEITHGKLDESSYTYSVKTYSKMFGLTRQMQINDDLGAFAEIPRLLGRGSALMEERLFWTLVLANTGNFFHASNGNLITKVLGSEGLGLAVKALEEQTDDQDDPILVMGKYLVVGPALRVAADELYQSTNVNTGGASTKEKVPNRNVFAGRYEPVGSPYASNTSFHESASSTAWYLWGDPADVAAFGFASLNGQSAPVVEEVPLSGEYLGKAWRGYRDVGVCQIDKRGAVKSTGASS